MQYKMQPKHCLTVVGLCSVLVMAGRAHAVDVADSWEADQLKQHGIQACVPAGASAPEPMSAYDEHTMYRGDDCDDGRYCNGSESCTGSQSFRVGDERREVYVCESTGPPCGNDEICSGNRCLPRSCSEPDADGDGHARPECGGDDCDDTNPNRFPGNTEICDEDGIDEDCDVSTFGNKDSDGDGYVDAMCFNYKSGR